MLASYIYILSWSWVLFLSGVFQSPISYIPSENLIVFLLFSFASFVFIDKFTSIKSVVVGQGPNQGKLGGHQLLFFTFLGLLFVSSTYSKFLYPILKLIGVDSLEYNEFGVPGLQGLVNSLYLSYGTLCIWSALHKGNNRMLLVFFALSAYPLLMLSRQMLFSLLVQAIVLWILYGSNSKIGKFFILSFVGVFGVIVFGVIGNIRTGDEVISSFMGEDADISFSIFYWIYVYSVSPISNLSYNTEFSSPDWSFITLVSSLLPTPIRTFFGANHGFLGFENMLLINDNLNMATFFASGFFSFGWWGMFFLLFNLLFILAVIKKNYNSSPYFALCYAVLLQILLFSPFTNLLFYLPVFFQFPIFYALHKIYKIRYQKLKNF